MNRNSVRLGSQWSSNKGFYADFKHHVFKSTNTTRRNDQRKHIQTSESAGCKSDPKTVEAKRKVKLEVQGKIFSCTSQQNYSELFGLYDQQKVRLIIFIYLIFS